MKMNNFINDGREVLTLDEYRILHLSVPRPKPTAEVEDFLVRPPAKPQVLVIKKGDAPTTKTSDEVGTAI